MDIDIINTFLTIVEHKSFTKAAISLCISLAALSHRLNLLETELGKILIVRNRGQRKFFLTEAGIDFIPLAEQWSALVNDTKSFKNAKHIHSLSVSNVETLTQVFGKFYKQFTDSFNHQHKFLFHTYSYPSFQTINEVENQSIDIGFIVRQRNSKNLKIEPIFSEKHFLLGAIGSDKKIIDPRTLDPHKELLTAWSSAYTLWHDWYLGSNSNPFAVVDTATTVIELLTEGNWCIVPNCAANFLTENCALKGVKVQTYEVPYPPPNRICYKVTHRFPSTNRRESINFFEEKLSIYLKESDLHL